MSKIKIIILFIFLFLSSNSYSSFLNGSNLYSYCKSESVVEKSYCSGFIAGAFDTYVTQISNQHSIKSNGGNPNFQKCNLSKVSDLEQVIDVVVNFLDMNPKHRKKSADFLIETAVAEWLDCGVFREVKKVYVDKFGYRF